MRAILFLTFSLTYAQILACSCPGINRITQKDVDFYKAIFVGVVIEVERMETGRYFQAKLLVGEHFKGAEEDTITLITSEGGCGYLLEKGEAWLIFAAGPGPFFELHRCSRSMRLNIDTYVIPKQDKMRLRLQEDLEFLRKN